jgi:PKD repeat protein
MHSKKRFAATIGLIIFVSIMLNACSTLRGDLLPTIYPNLEQAREEGFHLLAGHPPFAVDFHVEVGSDDATLSYDWDLDGDDASDSDTSNPRFVYTQPGEYTASVSITDERRQKVQLEQRIVVIGEPEWPDWRFGTSAHFNDAESDAELQKQGRMIAEAGIEAVRTDIAWAEIQPDNREEFEWEKFDPVIALSQSYGFGLLPIIGYSSEWASTARDAPSREDRTYAPPLPTEYGWFTYNAVDRYKAHVRAWEVWNEPNLPYFWRPEPNPALYTELLKQAYLAIKYADPRAVVVLGGLAPDEAKGESHEDLYSPDQFLQVVYDRGGGAYFDVVGSHPYTQPSEGTDKLAEKLDALRIIVDNNSDDQKPIWLTEYGTAVAPEKGISGEVQGKWMTQSLDALSFREQASVVFWYNFRDNGNDPNDPLQNFGLVRWDYKTKPAYQAYKDYIAKHR